MNAVNNNESNIRYVKAQESSLRKEGKGGFSGTFRKSLIEKLLLMEQ